MRISKLSTKIFVKERISHEFVDFGKSAVSERVFAHFIGIFLLHQLFYEFFILCRTHAYHASISEFKVNFFNDVAVSIEWKVEIYVPIRASPVGGGEDFKAGDVSTGSADEFSTFSHTDPKISIFCNKMEFVDW